MFLFALVNASGGGEVPQWAEAVLPSGAKFTLEIAADPASIQRGYMFREKIEPSEGMLFIFETPGPYGFWMKNCKVALDMVWLDRERRVVFVAHDQQPCPDQGECPTVGPTRNAAYVLEIAAGTARREGLKLGDRITIVSEPPLP